MTYACILVVEDEAIVAKSLERRLASKGYVVIGTAATGTEALQMAGRFRPGLVLLDIRLRGSLDGIGVAQILRDWFAMPFVFLTAYCDSQTMTRAKDTDPFGYIFKPFSEKDLISMVERAFSAIGDTGGDPAEENKKPGLCGLESSASPLAVIDHDTRIILANRAFREQMGFLPKKDLDFSPLVTWIAKEDLPGFSNYLRIVQIDPGPMQYGVRVGLNRENGDTVKSTLLLRKIPGTPLLSVSVEDIIPLL